MAVWRALRGKDRGQSTVEFALVAPLFLLMVLVLFDLGRAVYYYNSVSNLAREGARAGIVVGQESESQWYIAGNKLGTYSGIGSYSGTDTIVGAIASKATLFDLSQVTVSIQAPNNGSTWRDFSNPLTVNVQYPFTFLLAGWFPHPPTIMLSGQTTMIIE